MRFFAILKKQTRTLVALFPWTMEFAWHEGRTNQGRVYCDYETIAVRAIAMGADQGSLSGYDTLVQRVMASTIGGTWNDEFKALVAH